MAQEQCLAWRIYRDNKGEELHQLLIRELEVIRLGGHPAQREEVPLKDGR